MAPKWLDHWTTWAGLTRNVITFLLLNVSVELSRNVLSRSTQSKSCAVCDDAVNVVGFVSSFTATTIPSVEELEETLFTAVLQNDNDFLRHLFPD